ncbi:MAG: hypothetical protein KTR15_13790 [Phycisphaeraceae bacterium]|nr:hypothetical protein [Phycisphaeraceae bacterium]
MDANLVVILLRPIAFPEPEEITHRSHLERWVKRARRRRKILLIGYLIGALPLILLTAYFTALSAFRGHTINLNGLVFSLLPSCLCFGPIVLLLTWMVLSSGISQYERLVGRLRSSNRVCNVCDAIALYGDRYYLPSKQDRHTRADLIPHMNVIKEDGHVNVLCDQCLAEVNAIDSA